MPAVPVIMFFVSLVLGLLWKRGLPSLLVITFIIAVGFGVYLGNWAFLFPLSSLLHNLIYIAITMVGYFGLFIPAALVGAVLGNVLRNSIRKNKTPPRLGKP
jgi:hypothetical protein